MPMRGTGQVLLVVSIALLLAGCMGANRPDPRYEAHIVIEEAYLEPDDLLPERQNLVVVTKNLGPAGVIKAGGWLYYLDEDGQRIRSWSQRPPVPYHGDEYPLYWGAGREHRETYYSIPDNLHAIEVYIYWDATGGSIGSYSETVVIPYKRK